MNFDYNDLETPEGSFRISPSGISKFFDYPSVWYRDNFLGENSFTGNTASTLGTIIHAVAEAVALNDTTERSEIEEYLDTITDPEIDKEEILKHYPEMANVLVNEYLLKNVPDTVEQQTMTRLEGTNVYVGGTYDARNNSTLVDYKTSSKKPNTEKMPFGYLIQLLAYWYALKSEGIFIDRLRLVYIVKPTKTLPARVFVVNHMVTKEDEKMIEDTLKLMAETVELQQSNPELTHLLYKSMSLKEQ